MDDMRIGQLADLTGVDARTIRYNESVGLLPEPARTEANYRTYGEDDAERVAFIRAARSLGLGIDEIREVLAFQERGEAPCAYVRGVIDSKADEIDRQIEELERLRKELRRQSRLARKLPDPPTKAGVCHILENQALS